MNIKSITIRITGDTRNSLGFWEENKVLDLLEGMHGTKRSLAKIAALRMRELNADSDTFARSFNFEPTY